MKRPAQLPPLLTLVLISTFLFVVSRIVGPTSLPSAGSILKWFVFVTAVHWLGVVVHELGHAGFGLSQGMTLKQFAVGPLLIDWSNGRARFSGNGLRGLHGGYVRFTGETVGTGAANAIRAHFWMAAGGPAAGLLFGLILLESGSLMSPDAGWLKYGLLTSGLWGILISGINLLPLGNGITRSDGSWLRTLSRGEADARQLIASIHWVDLLHSLAPPGNWPPDIVEAQEAALARPQPLTANQLDLAVTAGYLLYFHYVDRHDWIEANHVISTAADLPRPATKRTYNSRFDRIDVLYGAHLALRGRNPKGARAALARIHPRSFVRRHSLYIGTLATIAQLEDEPATALELATTARNLLAPSLTLVAAEQIEDSWWAEVIERARASLPPSSIFSQETRRSAPGIAIAGGAASREELFAWDPGVPSDLRTIWIWRSPALAELDLSA